MPGTWTPLANRPTFPASTMLLLTDGTVMCQESGARGWWLLTPENGSYINGTWSVLTPMTHSRRFYASAVLADGRVFVAGGEYSDVGKDTNTAEIYDPATNFWTPISPPSGWAHIGDAPCAVLPDGRVLLGSISTQNTAIYDPSTNTWTDAGDKDDHSEEETWTLLPDGTVLTAECTNHPKSEKYVIADDKWVTAGNIPVDLVQASSIEIGPALLLPNGQVFAAGASGHTALYTPPQNSASQPGTWAAGPDFPKDNNGNLMEAKDAAACLMPNGVVLCAAGPAGEGKSFPGPTSFFEFDGTSLVAAPNPPNNGGPPFVGRMMLVPTGKVLFAAGKNEIFVYTPGGKPDPAWAPQITSCPSTVEAGHTYVLQGRQLNGLSQAVSYGDDCSCATNYPLVRIKHLVSGKIYFCRTLHHTTMGVATGASIQGTTFTVPFNAPVGNSELVVIANGIPSNVISLNVKPFHPYIIPNYEIAARLIGSLAEGPLWVLGRNCPVPVDPWAPKYIQPVKDAYASILTTLNSLERIAAEISAEQIKENAANRLPVLQGSDRNYEESSRKIGA